MHLDLRRSFRFGSRFVRHFRMEAIYPAGRLTGSSRPHLAPAVSGFPDRRATLAPGAAPSARAARGLHLLAPRKLHGYLSLLGAGRDAADPPGLLPSSPGRSPTRRSSSSNSTPANRPATTRRFRRRPCITPPTCRSARSSTALEPYWDRLLNDGFVGFGLANNRASQELFYSEEKLLTCFTDQPYPLHGPALPRRACRTARNCCCTPISVTTICRCSVSTAPACRTSLRGFSDRDLDYAHFCRELLEALGMYPVEESLSFFFSRREQQLIEETAPRPPGVRRLCRGGFRRPAARLERFRRRVRHPLRRGFVGIPAGAAPARHDSARDRQCAGAAAHQDQRGAQGSGRALSPEPDRSPQAPRRPRKSRPRPKITSGTTG